MPEQASKFRKGTVDETRATGRHRDTVLAVMRETPPLEPIRRLVQFSPKELMRLGAHRVTTTARDGSQKANSP